MTLVVNLCQGLVLGEELSIAILTIAFVVVDCCVRVWILDGGVRILVTVLPCCVRIAIIIWWYLLV